MMRLDGARIDIRDALRNVRRHPVASVVAVVSLAGAIGAATSTLVIRDAVFRKPPPLYAAPDQLSVVSLASPESSQLPVPAELYRLWTEELEDGMTFAASAAQRISDVRLHDHVDTAAVRPVVATLFDQLGVSAKLGVSDDMSMARADLPVVLSHGAARRLAGDNSEAVGRTIWIDNVAHTVVGVMPERFWYLNMDAALWTVIDVSRLPPEAGLDVIVRRGPGLTTTALAARLQSQLDVYMTRQAAADKRLRVVVDDVRGTPIGRGVGTTVVVLLVGAVLLTVLIACTNVSMLMIAHWTVREHELAIRACLGGTFGRIVRGLVTESVVLAVISGILGISLTFILRGLMVRNIPGAYLFALSIDPTVLASSTGLTLAVGILTGLAPALYQMSRLQESPLRSLRGSERVRLRVRQALVVFEIAATAALLVVASAMVSAYRRSLVTDPGFNAHNLLSVRLMNPGGVPVDQAVERLRAVLGTMAVDASTGVPFLASAPIRAVSLEGGSGASVTATAEHVAAGPEFFRTLQVPMVAGRSFGPTEVRSGPSVAIVNEVLARRLSSDVRIVGHSVRIDDQRLEVIGVVRAYATIPLREPLPILYVPISQLPSALPRIDILVRASGDSAVLAQTIRREVAALTRDTTVARITTMDQRLTVINREILAGTYPLVPLIAIGLVLTAAGVYGVLAFSVSRRSQEIALRATLGATGRDIVRLVAVDGARLLALGVAIGIGLTYILTRISQGQGGVFDAPGWQAFVLPGMVMTLVASIAVWIPAQRALRIRPMTLLRCV
jgi:putative ABC transport system permease protein